MKILFIFCVIETLAFFVGSFLAKTAETRGLFEDYAIWSMGLTMAVGFLAFG